MLLLSQFTHNRLVLNNNLSDDELNAHILSLIPEFSSPNQQYCSYLGERLGKILEIQLKKIPNNGQWKRARRQFPAAVDLLPDGDQRQGGRPHQQGNCDAQGSHGACGVTAALWECSQEREAFTVHPREGG